MNIPKTSINASCWISQGCRFLFIAPLWTTRRDNSYIVPLITTQWDQCFNQSINYSSWLPFEIIHHHQLNNQYLKPVRIMVTIRFRNNHSFLTMNNYNFINYEKILKTTKWTIILVFWWFIMNVPPWTSYKIHVWQ